VKKPGGNKKGGKEITLCPLIKILEKPL